MIFKNGKQKVVLEIQSIYIKHLIKILKVITLWYKTLQQQPTPAAKKTTNKKTKTNTNNKTKQKNPKIPVLNNKFLFMVEGVFKKTQNKLLLLLFFFFQLQWPLDWTVLSYWLSLTVSFVINIIGKYLING